MTARQDPPTGTRVEAHMIVPGKSYRKWRPGKVLDRNTHPLCAKGDRLIDQVIWIELDGGGHGSALISRLGDLVRQSERVALHHKKVRLLS